MLKKIDHLGIAVQNLDEVLAVYQQLGFAVEGFETVPDQKVRVAFLPVGESRLELIEATAADSPIQKFIEKKGEGIHHIAFRVEDLDSALKLMAERGFQLIDSKPRVGAHHKNIAFLHPKGTRGVLIELCEDRK